MNATTYVIRRKGTLDYFADFGAYVSLTERIVLACLCALAVLLAPLLEERE